MRRFVIALSLALAMMGASRGASTINTTLPAQGQPYNSTPIRNNFQAAANDIDALQTCNWGVTAPSAPASGYCWVDTSGGPIWVVRFYDAVAATWIASYSIDSSNALLVPQVGGGILPTLLSASTTDLGSVPEAGLYISGSNTINSFGSSAPPGIFKYLTFTGAATLIYNSTYLITPSSANVTVSPGTSVIAESLGSGAWRIGFGSVTACALATSGSPGCAQPDNTTITISGGVLSATGAGVGCAIVTAGRLCYSTGSGTTGDADLTWNPSTHELLVTGLLMLDVPSGQDGFVTQPQSGTGSIAYAPLGAWVDGLNLSGAASFSDAGIVMGAAGSNGAIIRWGSGLSLNMLGTNGGQLSFVNNTGATNPFVVDDTQFAVGVPMKVGSVVGAAGTQSGTTYTLASTDCGTNLSFSNSGAVTVTIPATLPSGCNLEIVQTGAGKVSVNGSAVSAATLYSAHSFTGTSAQYAAIGINIISNVGGGSAVAILTGDGS